MAADSLRVITGPTAAGKSALAMELARVYPAWIISADSRQVYRGFDIGTAKPSDQDRCAVEHRGVDVAEPTERYSAARWATAADRWVEEARAAGHVPLLVGGTGFYLRALFDPLFAEPPMDPERRKRIQEVLATMETAELRRWVTGLDPVRAHLGRAQLVRAIEVALLAGRRMSDLHVTHARTPRFTARYLIVDPGDELRGRIAGRAKQMLHDGWAEEVAGLVPAIPHDAPAWNSTGYRAVRDVVEGRLPRERALERVVADTWQYARRQRTWFRHQIGVGSVTRLDVRSQGAEERLRQWWAGEDP